MPAHIAKPDYALSGIPVSENAKRGSAKIDILSADEQKRLRKVSVGVLLAALHIFPPKLPDFFRAQTEARPRALGSVLVLSASLCLPPRPATKYLLWQCSEVLMRPVCPIIP